MSKQNKKNQLIVQSNDLVEAKIPLTLNEIKLWLYVVSMVDYDDDDTTTYRMYKKDFLEVIGDEKGGGYTQLRKNINKIQTKLITLKEGDDEIDTALLGSSLWNSNKPYVDITIDDKLKPHILRLKEKYTMYSLINVMGLKSIFSIRIYQLLKQYEVMGRRLFRLEDLKYKLAIDGSYRDYFMFKKRVLNVAVKEINDKTDIMVGYAEIKKQKKVISIEFDIQKDKARGRELQSSLNKKTNSEKMTVNRLRLSNEKYFDMLKGIGMTDFAIRRIMDKNEYPYVKYVVNRVKEDNRLGKVNNVGGYVKVSIEEDFYLNDYHQNIIIKKNKEDREKVLMKKRNEDLILDKTEALWIKEMEGCRAEVMELMENDIHLDDFLLSIDDNPMFRTIIRDYKTEGTMGYFNYKTFLTSKILGEEATDFRMWFKKKYDIDIHKKGGEWVVVGDVSRLFKMFG